MAPEEDVDTDMFFTTKVKYYCQGRGCRHKRPPEFNPNAICFYMRKSVCSHEEVRRRIADLLPIVPGSRIVSIQYVPLSVHLDTPGGDIRYGQRHMKPGLQIRWVVTLNSVEARNRLAGLSVRVQGHKVTLRRYDDVIQLEYRKCARSTNVQTMVHKITGLEKEITDLKT